MSTPQPGAVAPYQGQAVTPSAVIDSKSAAAHSFSGVISRLVRDSGVFRNESEVLSALDTVAGFVKHMIEPGQHNAVKREHDVAPVEDVRLRTPPANAGVVPQMGNTPPIDYALLAQYIVAAQKAQEQAPAPEVHEITDVPASDSGSEGF